MICNTDISGADALEEESRDGSSWLWILLLLIILTGTGIYVYEKKRQKRQV